MNRTDKSNLFVAYNKARSAARHGKLDLARVNRALGVAQAKSERPYNSTVNSCDCPDHRKTGKPCKHMIAKMLEVRAVQYQANSAPVIKVQTDSKIYHEFSDSIIAVAEQVGATWFLHTFWCEDDLNEWIKNGRHYTIVHPRHAYGRKRGEVRH